MAGIKSANKLLFVRKSDFAKNFTARALWEIRRIWRRVGWSIAISVACLGLASLAWLDTKNLKKYENLLMKKLQIAQSQNSIRSPDNITKKDKLENQLSDFYAYLPAHDAIPDQLKQLINLAQKNDVVLVQAEYKAQAEINADFLRYQIILPVKASYPNIQTFIIHTLQELPTLTLETVTFKRERIESVDVDAKIQYVLLVRKPSEKGKT